MIKKLKKKGEKLFSVGAITDLSAWNLAIGNAQAAVIIAIEQIKSVAKPNLYNSADDCYCRGVKQACDELEQKLFGGGDEGGIGD